jgi:hypothetical protein
MKRLPKKKKSGKRITRFSSLILGTLMLLWAFYCWIALPRNGFERALILVLIGMPFTIYGIANFYKPLSFGDYKKTKIS